MEKVLQKCINEEFSSDFESLDFACSKIEISLKKDQIYKGVIDIVSTSDTKTEAYIYSSNIRMQCTQASFKGTEGTIHYQFDSSGLEEGDVIQGEISIISNKGEYYIPFVVTMEHVALESAMGNVKNLFHFANVAKTDWGKAVQMFYSTDFISIFTGVDKQYFDLYRGLARDPGNQTNVDEFLVEINKKKKMEYIIEGKHVMVSTPGEVAGEEIRITRNGWGYTRLEVQTDGDFLYCEKEYLTEDDFLGNLCILNIYVNSHRLHKGYNFGKVIFHNGENSIETEITVVGQLDKKEIQESVQSKKLIWDLTRLYLGFRGRKITTADWLKASTSIIEEMTLKDENNCIARLFQAQLLITEERFNEAKWVLDHVSNLLKDSDYNNEIGCYYLYLTTLYNREESYVNQITEQIEETYLKNSENWRIAWLLLYLKEEYRKSPSKHWLLLEHHFNSGSASPILFIEAVYLMNMNPGLISKLSGFDLHALLFAAKKGLLTEEAVNQVYYLMSSMKEYDDKLFVLMKECNRVHSDATSLQLMVSLLIRGNKIGEKYFTWYEAAIKAELKITRLYEYYMMSIPLSYTEELPKIVMLYFAYDSSLSYERNAFLYANIIRHKNMFPEMMQSYREQMRRFIFDQLYKGHINRDLAYLYQELLEPSMITAEMAQIIAPVLFTHEIIVDNPNITQIAVIHEGVKGEVRYPVIDQRAIVSIYTNSYKIFLQSEDNHRYLTRIPYTIEKLMLPRKLARELNVCQVSYFGFDLFLCENTGNHISITSENVSSFQRLAQSDAIRNEYKRSFRSKLVLYFYEHDMIREMDDFLQDLSFVGTDVTERSEIISFFVQRGMYDKAYEWIKKYGFENITAKTLVRLCTRLIEREHFARDEYLILMSHHAFRANKYNEIVLEYLISYFKGQTREMRNIWKSALEFNVDAYALSERILIQMLFSGAFVGEQADIYRYYVQGGGDAQLRLAFLTHCAYEYFVKERVVDTLIFNDFMRYYKQGEKLGIVCSLAFLKHCHENLPQIDKDFEQIIKDLIIQSLGHRIYFPFFMDFISIVPRLQLFLDQTMIEYRAVPNSTVMIHYILEKEGDEGVEYKTEEMQHMYGGIFVKAFVLFFGERLQYYIMEENVNREQLTESGHIEKNDISRVEMENRFTILNDIVIGKTLQDYDTVDNLMEEYTKKQYLVEHLFELM